MLTIQSLSPRAIAHNGLFVPTRETAICPAVDPMRMRTFCRWVPALALDLYLNQLIATPSEYSFHLSQLLARPAASIWRRILRKKSSHTKNRARRFTNDCVERPCTGEVLSCVSTTDNQQVSAFITCGLANTFRYVAIQDSHRSVLSHTSPRDSACLVETELDQLSDRLPIPLIGWRLDPQEAQPCAVCPGEKACRIEYVILFFRIDSYRTKNRTVPSGQDRGWLRLVDIRPHGAADVVKNLRCD